MFIKIKSSVATFKIYDFDCVTCTQARQPQHRKIRFFFKNRPIYFDINSTSVIRPIKQGKLSFSSIEINKSGFAKCYNSSSPSQSSHGGTVFFICNNLNLKLRSDPQVNKSRSLESSLIEIIFPNKRNIFCDCLHKHSGIKSSNFNESFVTPLLDKILKEEKIHFSMGDFNLNLLNIESKYKLLDFYDALSSH